jgi:hypothetical protein
MQSMVAVAAVSTLFIAACGGDDSSADAGDTPAAADDGSAGDGDASDGGDDAPSGGGGGAGGGSLVLGDETITFDSARCFLEEQDAAAGGGKILFVAQAFGTNAAGDELVLDVSRYDEDSQFAGDDIIVDIGDPFSDTAVSLNASEPIGTVSVDGSTLSASGLTFIDVDDFEQQLSGSFEVNC